MRRQLGGRERGRLYPVLAGARGRTRRDPAWGCAEPAEDRWTPSCSTHWRRSSSPGSPCFTPASRRWGPRDRLPPPRGESDPHRIHLRTVSPAPREL